MSERLTYAEMMVTLEESWVHWGVNCNEAGRLETKLDKEWFDENCQAKNCALCELLDGCVKCPLKDKFYLVCCKEWYKAYCASRQGLLGFHNILDIEERISKELWLRRGLTGLWYRLKWRLT